MGKILNKVKYAAIVGGGSLLAIAGPAAATTSDLVNDTTDAVENKAELDFIDEKSVASVDTLYGIVTGIRNTRGYDGQDQDALGIP